MLCSCRSEGWGSSRIDRNSGCCGESQRPCILCSGISKDHSRYCMSRDRTDSPCCPSTSHSDTHTGHRPKSSLQRSCRTEFPAHQSKSHMRSDMGCRRSLPQRICCCTDIPPVSVPPPAHICCSPSLAGLCTPGTSPHTSLSSIPSADTRSHSISLQPRVWGAAIEVPLS